jgi:alkaline phosphatase
LGAHLFLKSSRASQSGADLPSTPKYVFIFLADGAGIPQLEMARQYSLHIEKKGLVILDKILKEGSLGLMTTHPANSLSTDSAAAATALASGCKANLGALGMCADGSVPQTVMELAKEKGMRIGLVTNATVYDATPAAFVCHIPNRRLYSAILDRYLDFEPDILLGGGKDQFLPQSQPGSQRKDDVDMIASFRNKGYLYVSDKQELSQASSSKVLGLFSLKDMSFEIDRDKEKEPSLYDMTADAIRILEAGNQRGFVVLIETEHTDTAGHLTDVASVIRDFLEFDRAVGLAYEFYRKHPRETLILVASDHDTGGVGFTLALKDLTSTRGSNQVAATVEDLKKIQWIRISLKKAREILGPSPTPEAIDDLMRTYFKDFTLVPDIRNLILNKQPISRTLFVDPIANALGMMIANNTQAYWMTTSHTNHPVFVAALGVGAEKFKGYQDNTDFGKHLMDLLSERKRG